MTTSPGEPGPPLEQRLTRAERARTRIPLRALREPVHLLALGFGAGLAPVAPGTFGSLVGLALGLLVLQAGWWVAAVAALLASVAGIWICGASARRLGVHDHPAIVWDEVAGMMLVTLAAPPTWWGAALGFLLFRLFDVWKPWPIREADHGIPGGAGIMLDDILAALMAAAVLLLVRHYT
ncbi:MAG TPA: phosphatidylglycerophosphatase A [Steroidobacteraceae bacterium]|nr:phosphatidylglycerophosphatase A [Steroidobacteraceae bacterium]